MRMVLMLIGWFAVFDIAGASAREVDSAALGDGVQLAYYASAPAGVGVRTILIAVQGYTRDANRTFDAAARAAGVAGQAGDTLIVAPIFQVPAAEAEKCHFLGVPAAGPGDALWHCGGWADGAAAMNAPVTSFAAMDRLEEVLTGRYPEARMVVVAGFSAGGQFVQHYVGFARPPAGLRVRYVVADPSAFLYFDAWRPVAGSAGCPGFNDWKYGTENLPADLGRDAAAARAAYAAADVRYLEGALDSGSGQGTAFKLLEKGCGAMVQGAFRLQRGAAYAAYDAAKLGGGAHRLSVVPGCAHAVRWGRGFCWGVE
jgi:hypothetical protein